MCKIICPSATSIKFIEIENRSHHIHSCEKFHFILLYGRIMETKATPKEHGLDLAYKTSCNLTTKSQSTRQNLILSHTPKSHFLLSEDWLHQIFYSVCKLLSISCIFNKWCEIFHYQNESKMDLNIGFPDVQLLWQALPDLRDWTDTYDQLMGKSCMLYL